MEQDALAVEQQANFTSERDCVVDWYNVCPLVKCNDVRKLKAVLLQVLREGLGLEVPAPAVRRKAPYIAFLQEVVDSCPCSLK